VVYSQLVASFLLRFVVARGHIARRVFNCLIIINTQFKAANQPYLTPGAQTEVHSRGAGGDAVL
jgi:hypothetical protein